MGGVGWVGSYALLSSSPSLIWLQLGFGLARAMTIEINNNHILGKCLDVTVVKMQLKLSLSFQRSIDKRDFLSMNVIYIGQSFRGKQESF